MEQSRIIAFTPSSREARVPAEATATTGFLGINIAIMMHSTECQLAAKGVKVSQEGITFQDRTISNEGLVKALRLGKVMLNFNPLTYPEWQMTHGMLNEIGATISSKGAVSSRGVVNSKGPVSSKGAVSCKATDVINISIPHTAWNSDPGRKAWFKTMQERIFLGMRASSITVDNLKILYDIYKHPHLVLGYWKLGMKSVAADKKELHSTFNLLMGYVLKYNSGEPEQVAPISVAPTRSAILRTLKEVDPTRQRRELNLVARQTELSGEKDTAANITAGEFSEIFMNDLLKRTENPPPPYQDLLNDVNFGINMALSEVQRQQIDFESRIAEKDDELTQRSLRIDKIVGTHDKAVQRLEADKVVLANKLRDTEEAKQSSQRSVEQLESKGNDLAAKVNVLEATEKRLKEEKGQEIAAKQLVEERVRQLVAEITGLQESLKQTEKEKEQDKEALKLEKGLVVQLKTEHKNCAVTIQELSAEVSQLKSVPKASPKELEEVKSKLASAEADATAAKVRIQELGTQLASAEDDVKYWKGQGEFLSRVSRTPDQKQKMLSNKKRKLDELDAPVSEEDIDKIVEKVQQLMTAGPQAKLEELIAYRQRVQQSAQEQLSYASSRASHEGATVEAYYQIMSLLVETYRVAIGIEQTHLSSSDWEVLIRDMPLAAKEVLPRMLLEERLTAENPVACDVMLGGLKNLQVSYMMTAQHWAMFAQRPERDLVQPIPVPCSSEDVERWAKQGNDTLLHLEDARQRRGEFLDELEYRESKIELAIGARRMRWAYEVAGWNEEGSLVRAEDLSIPAWMVDFTQKPPTEYVENMFPANSPDPCSMRIMKEIVDLGEYLPHAELLEELEKQQGKIWDGLGPSDSLMRWLEYCIDARPDLSHFGDNVPVEFAKARRKAQQSKSFEFQNEDSPGTLPSIYMGGIPQAPKIRLTPNGDRSTMVLELRSFYMSFHSRQHNEGGLRDPRLLVAYVVARGLVMLLEFGWRCKERNSNVLNVEHIQLFGGAMAGGWTLYYLACSIGPQMVRWLTWVGRTGYLPGLHANLVRKVDISPMWPMLDRHWRQKRISLGFVPTATTSNDQFKFRKDLASDPKEDRYRQSLSSDLYIEHAKWVKNTARVLNKCNRHPRDDNEAQTPLPKKQKREETESENESDSDLAG